MAKHLNKSSKRRGGNNLSRDVAVARNISQGNIYSCVRTVNFGTITLPAATDGGSGRRFSLSDLPGSSDFTNLFDQYRITAVEIVYVFSTHILASQARYPRITFSVDYTDASTPASENAVLEYQNSETYQFGQTKHTFKRMFKPRAALAAFEGAFTGYGAAPPNMWFDCSDSGVQYYGVKEWVSNFNSTLNTGAIINVYARYHMDFKNAR